MNNDYWEKLRTVSGAKTWQDFADYVGVRLQTVLRWRKGEFEPSGPGVKKIIAKLERKAGVFRSAADAGATLADDPKVKQEVLKIKKSR